MVDLARQAFSTNNFGLAADIYERTIRENGPQAELYLGLADSFARAGQITKAFEAYTNAFRLGRVTHEKLKHLVTALIETLSVEASEKSRGGCQRDSMKGSCMFTCVLCRSVLNDPVTIKCGHTFCRKCLEREGTKTCKVCGIVHYRLKPSSIRTNVVLVKIINKLFPENVRAAELKEEGNKYFQKGDCQRAATAYTKAIQLSDEDHLLFSNRSHVFASLDQYNKALEDAEQVIKLRPDWPKGFFRKGVALFGLGQYEDAVIAFLQCLALDKEVTSAKDYLSRALHKILKKLPTNDPKKEQRQMELGSSPFRQLLDSNFRMSPFHPLPLPQLNADTLSHLRQIMDSTVAEASSFQEAPHQPHSLLPSVAVSSSACSPSAAASTASSSSMSWDSPSQLSSSVPGTTTSHLHHHHHHHPVDTTASNLEGSMAEQHRCYSSPALELTGSGHCSPGLCHRQRSRSQSPSRENSKGEGGRRKRYRHPSTTQPLSPTHSSPQKFLRSEAEEGGGSVAMSKGGQEVEQSLVEEEDLECSLCFRLFYQPVTTPCGHSFCRACLDRCLDHQTSCPMCKSSLTEYLAERRSTVTEALQAVILNYLPQQHQQRQKVHEDEVCELAKMGQDTQHHIPVFVCTLSFPTVPCPLHVFEPRYRLMIRQCMESGTRQFGMCVCLSDNEENFSDFGCMLEIRDVHFFPDGRSLVDTVGGRRFKVLSRGKRDGYNTARVEYLSDNPISSEDLPEIQTLQDEVYAAAKAWLETLPAVHKTRILQHFGTLPDLDPNPANTSPNGPAWAWWVMAVLPLENRVQLVLLAMASLKERLQSLRKVLRHLSRRK